MDGHHEYWEQPVRKGASQDVGFLTVNLAAYSPRPNTAAASWPDQVPEETGDRLKAQANLGLSWLTVLTG